MKVIIAGSRDIDDYEFIDSAINNSGFIIEEVVSGGAKGVDTIAELWATNNKIPVTVFKADWKNISSPDAIIMTNSHGQYDKKAGIRRNEKMAEYADALIAIWDGQSKGTKAMIDIAERKGLKVFVEKLWQ
jgi:hypothetical protein